MDLPARACSSSAASAGEDGWPGILENVGVQEIEGKGRGVRSLSRISAGVSLVEAEPIAILSSKIADDLRSDPILNPYTDAIQELCEVQAIRFPVLAMRMATSALYASEGFDKYWTRVYRLRFAALPSELHPVHQQCYQLMSNAFSEALGDQAWDQLSSSYSERWFLRVLGTLHINVIRCPETSSSALFETGSLFNHSCRPNVRVDWKLSEDGKQATTAVYTSMRAVSPGEELCISYADPEMDEEERQNFLHFGYGIRCGRGCDCNL